MKAKQSSPKKDELGIADFTPTVKSKANVSIWESPDEVKKGTQDLMTIIFENMKKGLPSLARLQREAMEGQDG